ncbi:unnamed protein product, partial [Polarella glacialis]
ADNKPPAAVVAARKLEVTTVKKRIPSSAASPTAVRKRATDAEVLALRTPKRKTPSSPPVASSPDGLTPPALQPPVRRRLTFCRGQLPASKRMRLRIEAASDDRLANGLTTAEDNELWDHICSKLWR